MRRRVFLLGGWDRGILGVRVRWPLEAGEEMVVVRLMYKEGRWWWHDGLMSEIWLIRARWSWFDGVWDWTMKLAMFLLGLSEPATIILEVYHIDATIRSNYPRVAALETSICRFL